MSNPAINAYFDRRSLGETIFRRRSVPRFLLQAVFNLAGARAHDTDILERDIVVLGRRMAPIITNLTNIPVAKKNSRGKLMFKIPMIGLKSVHKAEDVFKTKVGQTAYDPENAVNAAATAYMDSLAPLEDAIQMREEWYAAMLLRDGKVTVSGTDEEGSLIEFEIDFMRDASLKISLLGSAQWGQDGVSPYNDTKGWRAEQATIDNRATDVIFGSNAINDFLEDPKTLKLLDIKNANFGTIKPETIEAYGSDVTYYGELPEIGHIWSYSGLFVDDDGNTDSLIHPNAVVMFKRGTENSVDYGGVAYIDDGGNTFVDQQARSYSMLVNKEAGAKFDILKSKPMPGLWSPNTTMYIMTKE